MLSVQPLFGSNDGSGGRDMVHALPGGRVRGKGEA